MSLLSCSCQLCQLRLPHHEQVALNLLEKGAEIDKTDEAGCTALMLASQNGHGEVWIAFHALPVPHLYYVNYVHVSPCMSVTLLPNHEQVAFGLINAGAAVNAAAATATA